MEETELAQGLKDIFAQYVKVKMDIKQKQGLIISRFEVDEILAEMTGDIK